MSLKGSDWKDKRKLCGGGVVVGSWWWFWPTSGFSLGWRIFAIIFHIGIRIPVTISQLVQGTGTIKDIGQSFHKTNHYTDKFIGKHQTTNLLLQLQNYKAIKQPFLWEFLAPWSKLSFKWRKMWIVLLLILEIFLGQIMQ